MKVALPGRWLVLRLAFVAVVGGDAGCGSPTHVLSGAGGSARGGGTGAAGAAGAVGAGGQSGRGTAGTMADGSIGGGGGSGRPVDGAIDGNPAGCPKSVMEYCANVTGWPCTPTWAAVLADHSMCGPSGIHDARYVCGGYDLRQIVNVDVVFDSYYDPTTGALVAVWELSASAGTDACEAGPPDFIRPMCATSIFDGTPCPDSGAD